MAATITIEGLDYTVPIGFVIPEMQQAFQQIVSMCGVPHVSFGGYLPPHGQELIPFLDLNYLLNHPADLNDQIYISHMHRTWFFNQFTESRNGYHGPDLNQQLNVTIKRTQGVQHEVLLKI